MRLMGQMSHGQLSGGQTSVGLPSLGPISLRRVPHLCPSADLPPTLPINISTNDSLVYSILNEFKKATASKVHRPSIILSV